MAERETFDQFLARNPQYQPQSGELMSDVYRKQHSAFVAYVDASIAPALDRLFSTIERYDEAIAKMDEKRNG